MFLIWSGKGFLIPIIVFLSSLLAELISEAITKDDNYYQSNLIPLGVSLIISGLFLWILSGRLKKSKPKIFIEKETGKEFVVKKDNNFFFIPFEYWPSILIGIGFIVIVIRLLRK